MKTKAPPGVRERPRVVKTCSYCHDELNDAVFCASCLAPHHRDCFVGHGECSLPGCSEERTVRPQPTGREPAPRAPRRVAQALGLILATTVGGMLGGVFVTYHAKRDSAEKLRVQLARIAALGRTQADVELAALAKLQREQPTTSLRTQVRRPERRVPLRLGMNSYSVRKLLGPPDQVRDDPVAGLTWRYREGGVRLRFNGLDELEQALWIGTQSSRLESQPVDRPLGWTLAGVVAGKHTVDDALKRLGRPTVVVRGPDGVRYLQFPERQLTLEIDPNDGFRVQALLLEANPRLIPDVY